MDFESVIWGLLASLVVYIVIRQYCSPSPPPQPKPSRKTIEPQTMTREQLQKYDGTKKDEPILMAVKGRIYDVSRGEAFYGPGGPYASFAGRDASRALAKHDTSKETADNPNISDLTPDEKATLEEWAQNYEQKYPFIGLLQE